MTNYHLTTTKMDIERHVEAATPDNHSRRAVVVRVNVNVWSLQRLRRIFVDYLAITEGRVELPDK